MRERKGWIVAAALLAMSGFVGGVVGQEQDGTFDLQLPRHFDERVLRAFDNTPADNPVTEAGAELGRWLFYDTRLSTSGNTSCATCHQQEKAFAEPRRVSIGHTGTAVERNAMSLVNLRFQIGGFLWDERAARIEDAVRNALYSQIEMGQSPETIAQVVQQDARYAPMFRAAFGSEEITEKRIVDAIAQFVRSLVSADSRYDRAAAQVASMSEDFPGFTELENRGKNLFMERCHFCHHTGETQIVSLFGMFRTLSNRIDGNAPVKDGGRGDITFDVNSLGTFRASSLRNVEVTGPYMHDGRFETLEQVLEHYATTPGIEPASKFIYPQEDKRAIIAFLKTLTDETFLTNPHFADPWKKRYVTTAGESVSSSASLPVSITETSENAVGPTLDQARDRLEKGLGLRDGELDVWLDSLDVDGDDRLSLSELEPIVRIMVDTDRLSLRPLGLSRQPTSRDNDTASLHPLSDFNGDGVVDAAEQRRAASLARLVRLHDGGRSEVLVDRVMTQWRLPVAQDVAIRQLIGRYKADFGRRMFAADIALMKELATLMGEATFRDYQRAVLAFNDSLVSPDYTPGERESAARQSVIAFDRDNDGYIAGEERTQLRNAMHQVAGGFGYRTPRKPSDSSDPIDRMVQRLLHLYGTHENSDSSTAFVPVTALPERLARIVAADADQDGKLTAEELANHILAYRFERLLRSGVYIGGGFVNTPVRTRSVVDQLEPDETVRQSIRQLLDAHERELEQWIVQMQQQVFREVAQVIQAAP